MFSTVVFRRCGNVLFTYGLMDQMQCSKCKVREFSQKINNPTNQPEAKEKIKKYLYTIPPWMKKDEHEKLKNEQTTENKKAFNKVKKNNANSIKNEELNKLKTLPELNQTRKSIRNHEIVTNSIKEETTDGKENSATSILAKDEKCLKCMDEDFMKHTLNVINNNKKLNEKVINTNSTKQSANKTVKEIKSTDFRPPISSDYTMQTNSEGKQIKPTRTENIRRKPASYLLRQLTTPRLTDQKEENQHKKPNINTAVKILNLQPRQMKELNENLKQTPKINIITNSKTESFTKINKESSPTSIKMNDITSKDSGLTWGKEKIDAIKKKEFEPIVLNKAGLVVISNKTDKTNDELTEHLSRNERNKIRGSKTKIKKDNLDAEKTFISRPNKLKKTKFGEKKDEVILKVISNPLKLDSKESLYAGKELKENAMKMSPLKELIMKRKPRNGMSQNEVRNIKQLIKRNQNIHKENNCKINLNNYSTDKQLKNYEENNIVKKNSAKPTCAPLKLKKYLKELSTQKNSQNDQIKNLFAKEKQRVESLKNINLNKRNTFKSPTVGNIGKKENNQKPNLNSIGMLIGHKIQSDSRQNYNRTAISQGRCKTLPKIAKKPIHLFKKPSGKADPAADVIQFTRPKIGRRKQKPVFGPPCQQNSDNGNDSPDGGNHRSTLSNLCVVNSDTCLPNNQTKPELCSTDDHARPGNSPILSKYQEVMTKLGQFINICKLLIAKFFKNTINYKVKLLHSNGKNNEINQHHNKPSDNLSISLLVTENQKQPIYICDTCSYLFKSPNIYERLKEKINNFSHMIKTKETLQRNSVNGATIHKDSYDKNTNVNFCNLKTNCKKSRKVQCKKKIPNRCPEQAYSEVLNNLLTTHLQTRSKTQ